MSARLSFTNSIIVNLEKIRKKNTIEQIFFMKLCLFDYDRYVPVLISNNYEVIPPTKRLYFENLKMLRPNGSVWKCNC